MIAISSPRYAPETASFHWQAGPLDGPFSLVVLTEDYLPHARFDGIEGSSWSPDAGQRELFEPGTRYLTYLLAPYLGRQVKSALIPFDWQ